MENWEDESLKNQSKLYLLDTSTDEILWTHDMGWESWSADITDDGRYVVFGTHSYPGQTGFTHYIRLLNGIDGSMIWTKEFTPENFPGTRAGFCDCSNAVKFKHIIYIK